MSAIILSFAFIAISASFTSLPHPDHDFQNLKVLPKNITEDQLDSVMDHFKASLGVKCSFCHAETKDPNFKGHLDFASDEKPEKLRAREMFQMTAFVNENFFNPDHSSQPDTIHEVICYTCHRGASSPHPEELFLQVDSIVKARHKK